VSLIAVLGDASTTTAVALTAALRTSAEVVLAEFDPTGGDLAAWLDVPEQPGLASAVAATPSGGWLGIERHLQLAHSGLRVLVAPVRAVEAAVVVREAATRIIPILSALDDPIVVADCGRQQPSNLSPVVTQAGLVVLTVRQPRTSAAAAAAHLDRVAELADALAVRSLPVVLLVMGEEPYTAREIASFVGGGEPAEHAAIADDAYGAALVAGRPGNGRRAARSRLLGSAAAAAPMLVTRLRASRSLPTEAVRS
jgi:MinD-like ATPase involved in chromosome partitioning or flagellar assembly